MNLFILPPTLAAPPSAAIAHSVQETIQDGELSTEKIARNAILAPMEGCCTECGRSVGCRLLARGDQKRPIR